MEKSAAEELLAIVKALNEWYQHTNDGSGPNESVLLFDDDKTLAEHIKDALARAEVSQ